MKSLQLLGVVLTLMSTSAWSQESDSWDWKIAPYLWTVGIDGTVTIGSIEQDLDVSFSDLVSDLEIGGSVYAEFGKGHNAVHFDYTYLRLKPDPTDLPAPPFPMESTLSTKMTINIFETAYNYRWGRPEANFAVVLGARYLDIEMRMTADISLSEPIPGLPIDDNSPLVIGPNWWDYFVGIKTNHKITYLWDFDFYATVGGGDSDSPYTLQAMLSRRFSNGNRLGLGVRVWNLDYSEKEGFMSENTRLDATFFGLLIGYEFN